ncbi:MAG: ROK family protein [bacterium]
MPARTLAVDIGGTKFTLALFEQLSGESLRGGVSEGGAPSGRRDALLPPDVPAAGGEFRMVRRESRATNREGGRDWMMAEILEIARAWKQGAGFESCGIGFGGPVDFAAQRVYASTHVGGWDDFDLPGVLSAELGVPAVMDNDANAGALGEYEFGAGRGFDPLFYMTLSTGIGGGIVAGGRVVRGADSYAGELGHTTIRPDGPICLCGARGCLERLCAGIHMPGDHGKEATELMRDPEFVNRYVVDLAQGLKTAIMLLNPARIVIGGGIAKAGDALFVPLRRELRRQVTGWSRARLDVAPAALGDDSVLWGALALARQGA